MSTAPTSTAVAADLHLVVGRIARALRQAHTVGDLTHSEASTLARLDRGGPASPGMLADEERVSPQAIATTLASLEAKNYVVRSPDPGDGRRAIVSLTDEGAEVRRDRRTESARRLESGLRDVLDADELAVLSAAIPLLDRLAEAL
ncbi:MAG: MarR family transcriptional regulator [Nocardioides sp.]